MRRQLEMWLFRRVSGASLGVLRLGFGAVMLYEALWFLGWLPAASGSPNKIDALFTGEQVRWTFSYPAFGWVRPLSESTTTAIFAALAIASIFVMAGIGYRIAMAIVFLAFSYVNLMDASIYLNHFYLACVVALLMLFVPADRCFTVRSFWRGSEQDMTIPVWAIYLFRAQIFLVYFFAGIAKLNPDWLVGEPLRRWLPHPSTTRVLEPLLGPSGTDSVRQWLASEAVVVSISYGGLLFDLAIGFLLICRRTRGVGFVLAVAFHATNFILFDIGAFPFFALLLTTIFFEPDWSTRALRIGWGNVPLTHPIPDNPARGSRWVVPLLSMWLALQIVIPLRHLAIPGDVNWTEEGHRFSWHMKLRDKYSGPFHIEVDTQDADESKQGVANTNAGGSNPICYRQVNAEAVPWHELPELVLTYEPLLGERIIFNPLSRATWAEAAADAQRKWRNACGVPLELHRTDPLDTVLAAVRRRLNQADQQNAPNASAALHTLDELEAIHRDLTANSDNRAVLYLQSLLQDKLRQLVSYPAWRKEILSMMWQTQPFACLGSPALKAPFMIVTNREALSPDDAACCRIERDMCPELGAVLIDLESLTAANLKPLPQVISFSDFRGRPATFWNYTHELHFGQIQSLSVSPLLQHAYAQHIADIWQRDFGMRPRVQITSHVKLNQHTMQLMIDPQVDLANTRRRFIAHNSWILPLQRNDTRLLGIPPIAKRESLDMR